MLTLWKSHLFLIETVKGDESMAMTHEFGLMPDTPKPGERYDSYEPWNPMPTAFQEAMILLL